MHAFFIEGGREEGIALARAYLKRERGLGGTGNPDLVELRYRLLSVENAREVAEMAAQAPLGGDAKALIIAANRAYHEAQNALLKVFEEPPKGTILFLILPSAGMLLPTLRSRVQVLTARKGAAEITESACAFLAASREKRGALIKKLVSGKDEDERRENRDGALAILAGAEQAAYGKFKEGKGGKELPALLSDIAVLRGHLHERSSSVRMILEHLAIVLPRNLV